MVEIKFVHVPEGRESEPLKSGFVQVTYDAVRIGPDGEEIATRAADGLWEYGADRFTDFIVSAAVGV